MKKLGFALLLAAGPVAAQDDWPTHGGDAGGMKHSSLSQINRDTVNDLELVWTWSIGAAGVS